MFRWKRNGGGLLVAAILSLVVWLGFAVAPWGVGGRSWATAAGSAASAQLSEEPGQAPAPSTEEEEKSAAVPDEQGALDESVNRRSPKDTMSTFLNAIDEADRGEVDLYAHALACLDLSGLSDLSADARESYGRKLAGLLNDFIQVHGVEPELIAPDESGGDVYTYYNIKDEYGNQRPAIQIRRSLDGPWRFTWDSLAFVENPPSESPSPEPGAGLEDQQPESPKSPEPAQAEVPQPVTSEGVPSEFRSAQATMRTFRNAMKEGRVDEAARCLDLSDYAQVTRKGKGAELAALLHKAIRPEKTIVLPLISDNPDDRPYILRLRRHRASAVIARQGEGSDRVGQWLFTRDTVRWVHDLQGARLRSNIPDSLKGKWFLLEHWQWLGLGLLLAVGLLARWITISVLWGVTALWLRHKGVAVDKAVQIGMAKPVGILVGAAAVWEGLSWLWLRQDVDAVLLLAVKVIVCWAAVWTLYRAVDLLGDYFASLAGRTTTKMDDLLVPFARKTAKTLVTVFGVVFVLKQFFEDEDLTKIWAGLGLGGLAFALAAQDTLKNLFGSLTVVADRPFKVGDWVLIGDVEGTVESVGFRSTRLRTFYNSQITVPNASLMSATVDNLGARHYRRFKTMLSVTYSTPPEKLETFCEGIRELILSHVYTRKDYFHVYVNAFGPSSIDILLYCFFQTPDWGAELAQREKLILDILHLARRHGVDFAFPTQTVHVEPGGSPAKVIVENAGLPRPT